MKPRLLIVDDDEDIRVQMKWALANDYEVAFAEDRASALGTFREHPASTVLLDLGLPPHPGSPVEGLAILAELLARDQSTKVIIITGQSEKENAVRAIGDGAYREFQDRMGRLGAKDLQVALDIAREMGVELPGAAAARPLMAGVFNEGYGNGKGGSDAG